MSRRTLGPVVVLLAMGAAALTAGPGAATHVPVDDLVQGCPERDCVPSIDRPTFDDGEWLGDDDRVIGVTLGAAARAYPVRILNWHEVVNDVIGERNVSITYSAHSGAAFVVDRGVAERTLTFGVSGRLRLNDLVPYDRETGSLWSRFDGTAITGPLHATNLTLVPSVTTSWGAWKADHPTTRVLAPPEPGAYHDGAGTASARDYDRYPYGSYEEEPGALYPRGDGDVGELHPKAFVVGFADRGTGEAVAAPYADVSRAGAVNAALSDDRAVVFTIVSGGAAAYQSPSGALTWRGTTLVAADGTRYSPQTGADLGGGPALTRLDTVTAFAFAWFDHHPGSALVTSDADDRAPDAGGPPGRPAPDPWWEVPAPPTAGMLVALAVAAVTAAKARGRGRAWNVTRPRQG